MRIRPTALAPLAAILCLAGCTLFQPSRNAHVPQPAKQVDLHAYLGVWHEMARYDSSFEHDCEAATAQYGQDDNGRVTVLNQCRHGGPNGKLESAKGSAVVVPGSGNAKLKVSFFGPFYLGNYWVLDHAENYDWTIVGEPTGGYLWILTRAAHPPSSLRDELIGRVQAMGYDTASLHMTQQ